MSANATGSFLDQQIAALNELKWSAKRAYMMVSAIPSVVRNMGQDRAVEHVAGLVTGSREKLEACLDKAEHWLGPTKRVYVPVPCCEGEYDSACEGAGLLLLQLGWMCFSETEMPLRACDKEKVQQALSAEIQANGIPEWFLSGPWEDLKELATVAQRETEEAIRRVTEVCLRANAGNTVAPALPPGSDNLELAKEGPALTPELEAIALIMRNPTLSTTDVAKIVGVSRTATYRWPQFRVVRNRLDQNEAADIPRGSKHGGDIEASG